MSSKIIIDSRVLANKLMRFNDYIVVQSVSCSCGVLNIHIGEMEHEFIGIHTNDEQFFYWQQNVRWDWIRDTAMGLGERPIIIEFSNNTARIILEF